MSFLAMIAHGLGRPVGTFGHGADALPRVYVLLATFEGATLAPVQLFNGLAASIPNLSGRVIVIGKMAGRTFATTFQGRVVNVGILAGMNIKLDPISGAVKQQLPAIAGDVIFEHFEGKTVSVSALQGTALIKKPSSNAEVREDVVFKGDIFYRGTGII